MEEARDPVVREIVDALYRDERSRVLATLIRLLGDFDLAEDAMHEAFAIAADRWVRDGVPTNPRAWLISTGRFKAVDALRRETRLFAALRTVVERAETDADVFPVDDENAIEDDRLRLLFACCHPALSREGQVALTLREVCGLSTDEIANAFLVSVSAIAQRIVRAKATIREARIPYEVPPPDELTERIEGVRQVIYLLFNEGYYASSGESLTRTSLSEEAIRLGRLLADLLPDTETLGLLALMQLNESRRSARTSPTGEIVLLPDQDRSLWDGTRLAEGRSLLSRALASPTTGPYTLQAAIAAAHIEGALAGETDWDRIVGIYDEMLAVAPSAIVELNRIVAISKRDGPLVALSLLDRLLDGGELDGYVLAYSTRGEFCRLLDRTEEAHDAYARALNLTTQSAERRFLRRRWLETAPSRGIDGEN